MKVLFICLFVLLAGPAAAQDLFLFNANGYSYGAGGLMRFDALLIKDGRVQAAGPEAVLRPYAGEVVFRDLGGKTVFPGMVNAGAFIEESLTPACPEAYTPDCLAAALKSAASQGITLLLDTATSPALWFTLRSAQDDGVLPVRVHGAIAGLGEAYDSLGKRRPYVSDVKTELVLRSVSLTGGRRQDGCAAGPALKRNPVAFRNQISRGLMRGYQMRVDANTPKDVENALEAFADIASVAGRERRHLLSLGGLGQLPAAEDILAAGVVLVVTPCVTALQAEAFKTLFDAGIDLAISSPQPLLAFQALAGPDSPDSQDGRVAAFQALTLGGAKAAFVSSATGSLEPGKWADFVVLDRDPFAGPIGGIGNTKVLETWRGGEIVFDASE
ncbi:MAG: amidohydrolase family protein [Pseudomonadota bacterium]